jgi:hypothetical protein
VHPAAYREIVTPDDGASPDVGICSAPNGIRYLSRTAAIAAGQRNLNRVHFVKRGTPAPVMSKLGWK